jgi:hypothetical protein
MMACRGAAQRFASIERLGFFEIARLVRKNSNSEEKPVKHS